MTISARHDVPLRQAAGLIAAGRHADAARLLEQTIAAHGDDARSWINLAHLRRSLGPAPAAAAAYRRAIALSPGSGIAWWGLANLRLDPFAPDEIATMRHALATSDDAANRTYLHFALGHAYDRAGDETAAFAEWDRGNALRRAAMPHRSTDISSALAIRSSATPPVPPRAASGPIFVVGLPRSGSTLVEQILASHPLVEATGELSALNEVVRALPPSEITPDRWQDAGQRYLAAARRHRHTDRPFFVDKAPGNWVHAALIPAMLPGARIVDVRRHPMACGLANFAQLYARGNDFSYDLGVIGRFYGDYVRHMAQVDRVAPGLVHRVHHEALVDDLEGEVRLLLDALGLPFDAACLHFHETDRPIHSPSAAQVRRPIDRAGVDRWRRYERWLGPLADALGPVLDHHPAMPPGW